MSRHAYRCAPGSAAWITASPLLGFDISRSVRAILGGAPCSLPGSPAYRYTTTYAQSLSEDQRGELLLTDVEHTITAGGGKPGQGYQAMLISSQEAPPARTSQSPAAAPGSTDRDRPSSSSSPGSLRLFDPDGFSGRTYPAHSVRTAVGTSESCLERWPTSGTAWPGGFSTAVTSECRSDEEGCSSSEPSLSEILEPPQNVPARYSLSGRAARGILRRAEKRGRTLPSHLHAALEEVAASGQESPRIGRAKPLTPEVIEEGGRPLSSLLSLTLEAVAQTTTMGGADG